MNNDPRSVGGSGAPAGGFSHPGGTAQLDGMASKSPTMAPRRAILNPGMKNGKQEATFKKPIASKAKMALKPGAARKSLARKAKALKLKKGKK